MAATPTKSSKKAPLKVELTVVRVQVPAERRAAWHRGVANMYSMLEDLIELDRANGQAANSAAQSAAGSM
jgi:hypothetical protein